MLYEQKKFDWFSLIVGILFVLAGIASLMHPDKTLHFLAILVGIAFILRGIYELWFRQFVNRVLNEGSGWLMFTAILDIILGIIVLVYPNWGVLYIAILFAIWFIIDSVMQIKAAGLFREFHRGYSTWLVILGVLSVILGIILLFSPMMSAMTIVWLISLLLMVFGIMHIIEAF
ncbi:MULTISPECIES: HdeD family acid-resistance protein [Limosilactobacillus]|jgi:uncharacterized membrane protein HdeD (DUF308 family)|uniref:HdeD family acid-resistance protein n=1 Tax=Limosilactobacillus TaxID=2742598 RepID=UPI0022648E12|nr:MULTISPECIES: DUF308 domain-containing protein [Limosilactobacillus]MCH3923152.1 DUF308 domain-containing protein [Limosilactobacillus sp.]MCH3927835.1 DUF308 domain-containing protein [Limosilactobacillus sp.]